MTLNRSSLLALLLLVAAILAGCERPPVEPVQRGFRGTGMEVVYNPRILEKQVELNTAPVALPEADKSGPRASQV